MPTLPAETYLRRLSQFVAQALHYGTQIKTLCQSDRLDCAVKTVLLHETFSLPGWWQVSRSRIKPAEQDKLHPFNQKSRSTLEDFERGKADGI